VIAAGHSNKEIAADILAKLGFRSRTQIAAWVTDRQ